MKLIKNNYILALITLMIISAVIHIASLLIYTTISKNIQALNLFSIVGLNLLFPPLGKGNQNLLISLVVGLIIYLAALIFIRKLKSNDARNI